MCRALAAAGDRQVSAQAGGYRSSSHARQRHAPPRVPQTRSAAQQNRQDCWTARASVRERPHGRASGWRCSPAAPRRRVRTPRSGTGRLASKTGGHDRTFCDVGSGWSDARDASVGAAPEPARLIATSRSIEALRSSLSSAASCLPIDDRRRRNEAPREEAPEGLRSGASTEPVEGAAGADMSASACAYRSSRAHPQAPAHGYRRARGRDILRPGTNVVFRCSPTALRPSVD